MAKLSIEITNRVRSGLFLLSALFQQGPTVAKLVAEKIRSSLPGGEEPPDVTTQVTTLGQILQIALDRMVERDSDLYRENSRRAELLRDRDRKIADLGQKVIGMRRIVTGHYVAPDVAQLGLVGETAREPVALLRQTELVCDQLKGEGLPKMLGPALFEPPFDPSLYVGQIESGVTDLRLAHQTHQRSKRRVDELLAGKKKAVDEYDVAFVRAARQFEDLCRLADEADLAEKVRPSLTRKGETAVPPPEDGPQEAEEGESAADAEGGAPPEGEAASGSSDSSDSDPASEPAGEPATAPVSEPVNDSGSA